MNIACVLRKSESFGPEHVLWLKQQCDQYIPHDRFICYSDTPVDCEWIRLEMDWPLWWAKMEIYGGALRGPTLILDLDTVIRGSFAPTSEQLEHSWIMRHFVRNGFSAPEEFACGIMLTTRAFREKVFNHFITDPNKYIGESRGDDQRYFKRYFDKDLRRFQDEFPDAFVSYKLHVLQHGLTNDHVFVNFHGKPRPWDISATWIPKLELSHGAQT